MTLPASGDPVGLALRGRCLSASAAAKDEDDEPEMIYWSVVAALVGLLGTWFGMTHLNRPESHRPPEVYWVLGLAALCPAWLIAVLGLLGRTKGRFPDVSVAAWWILSGAAALLGVMVTDAMVRRLRESGEPYPPARYWVVGVGSFFPAWCIAMLGVLWTRPGVGA